LPGVISVTLPLVSSLPRSLPVRDIVIFSIRGADLVRLG
jgi:hypothetical protein